MNVLLWQNISGQKKAHWYHVVLLLTQFGLGFSSSPDWVIFENGDYQLKLLTVYARMTVSQGSIRDKTFS